MIFCGSKHLSTHKCCWTWAPLICRLLWLCLSESHCLSGMSSGNWCLWFDWGTVQSGMSSPSCLLLLHQWQQQQQQQKKQERQSENQHLHQQQSCWCCCCCCWRCAPLIATPPSPPPSTLYHAMSPPDPLTMHVPRPIQQLAPSPSTAKHSFGFCQYPIKTWSLHAMAIF